MMKSVHKLCNAGKWWSIAVSMQGIPKLANACCCRSWKQSGSGEISQALRCRSSPVDVFDSQRLPSPSHAAAPPGKSGCALAQLIVSFIKS